MKISRSQFYKTQICPWYSQGKCYMEENCNFAHTSQELRCKPNLIRTKMCPRLQECDDVFCQYCHDLNELRATDKFFKTKLCQYWSRGTCILGDKCRYAHGLKELKKACPESSSDQFSTFSTKARASASSTNPSQYSSPQFPVKYDDSEIYYKSEIPYYADYPLTEPTYPSYPHLYTSEAAPYLLIPHKQPLYAMAIPHIHIFSPDHS